MKKGADFMTESATQRDKNILPPSYIYILSAVHLFLLSVKQKT